MAREEFRQEALDNATVQPEGPRSGSDGNTFFNIEGSANDQFASFGVVDFSFADANLGLTAVDVTDFDLELTQSNAGFTTSGPISIYLTDATDVSIQDDSSITYQEDNNGLESVDPAFTNLSLLGSFDFIQTSTGDTDSLNLLSDLDAAEETQILDRLNNGDPLRLVVTPDNPDVAATYAGFANEDNPGPTISLEVSDEVVRPVINEVLASHTGEDNTEFFEIFGVPGDSLEGLSFIAVESETEENGTIDFRFDFTAEDTLGSNGFFLVGNPVGLEANYAVSPDREIEINSLENNSATYALVETSSLEGGVGSTVTSNEVVLDAVAATDPDEDPGNFFFDAPVIGPDGTFFPAGVRRVEDGVDTDTANDFVISNFNLTPENTPTSGAEEEPIIDPTEATIPEIQGEGATSDLEEEGVQTTGIVTAVDSDGFYFQDAAGDDNEATSDGLFVFTGSEPSVNVGDEVEVVGEVVEFGGGDNLPLTQINSPQSVTVLSEDNPLPEAVVLGNSGRVVPIESVAAGIDFYESLEGMRVIVEDAVGVSPIEDNEVYTLTNQGANSDSLSDRGTVNIGPEDFNPERILVEVDDGILPEFELSPAAVGATLGDVEGVFNYSSGEYQVKATSEFNVTASDLSPETTTLSVEDDELTVASYNVLNLDPGDPESKFQALGEQIANNLGSPDIIGLQEIQDNDGGTDSDIVAADQTLTELVSAIEAAGGPSYEFQDNPLIIDGFSGGQPGANIRTAYLYNPDRVNLVEGSVRSVSDVPQDDPNSPYNGSRLPLVADFEFNGETLTIVNNHFSSKGGSVPLFGSIQPTDERQEDVEVNGSLDERQAQSQGVQDFVNGLLADEPNANVVVLGDLNEFEFISPVENLTENLPLTNLTETLPENERYTFIFQGNSQSLDHILVSNNIAEQTQFDIVHTNAEFPDTPEKASDHEPLVASVNLSQEENMAIELNPIGTFETGVFDEGAAEIVSYDAATERLFVINSDAVTVDILDVSDPTNPTRISQIDATEFGDGANSVAVNNGLVAVAIEGEAIDANGQVVLLDTDGNVLNSVDVGILPDMVTFSPDGTKVLTANEAEPNEDYTVDPEGSVSIIDISGGVENLTQDDVTDAGFTAFNDQQEALEESGVRIFGPNATVAQDLEPEYITVTPDNNFAYVSLQENNALGVIDLRETVDGEANEDFAAVVDILPLGFKDHSQESNQIDASDEDGINFQTIPSLGMLQPDAIDSFEVDGETFIITANEGDAREYEGDPGFIEEVGLDDLAFNATPITATLSGDQEVPDVTTEATGTATMSFNPSLTAFDYEVTVSGLDFGEFLDGTPQTPNDEGDDVTQMHIHNEARGENGPVIFGVINPAQDEDDVEFTLNDDDSVTISGTWDLSDEEANNQGDLDLEDFADAISDTDFESDTDFYWNIHTEEFPAGEIRGQLERGAQQSFLDLNDDNNPDALTDAVNGEETLNDLLAEDRLGELDFTSATGDSDGDGLIEQLYNYGGRSFSIFDQSGNLLFDSGDDFEQITAEQLPDDFNANNDENGSFDSRSDDKGPEPEAVATGVINGTPYAFIGLERVGGIMAYDISNPSEPEFVQYLNNRNFRDENGDPIPVQLDDDSVNPGVGDLGPEGFDFIPAEDSPSGNPLLAVGNEVSGTTTIYDVAQVDEPPEEAFTLELLHAADQEGGIDAVSDAPRFSAVLNALREQDLGDDGETDNTITLSSGDAFIPGVFYQGSEGAFGSPGIGDIQIQNELGFQAITLGNHEFDFGTEVLAGLIDGSAEGEILGSDFTGADFPYLSANLDFSGDDNLAPLEVPGGQAPQPNSVTSSVVIDVNGEDIGVVGATTPTLASISSPDGVTASPSPFDSPPTSEQLDALAAEIQTEVDALLDANEDINKVILSSHMQQLSIEQGLAERLENVDIIIGGGSNTRLFDENDRARDGDTDQGEYPQFFTNAGGTQTALVNTDGSYKYVGRLVLDFDSEGNIIPESYDPEVSGAFATDEQGVNDLNAEDLVDPEVQEIADAIEVEIIEAESNVFGLSDVFLNGIRAEVRTQETNLGNLTADANLAAAQEADEDVVLSLKNGGGIRDPIGEVVVPPGGSEAVRRPNQELVDSQGNVIKPEGGISEVDIDNALSFNNRLSLLTLTKQEIVDLLEHGISVFPESAGQFPQIGGAEFSFDPELPEGDRIVDASIVGDDGNTVAELVSDGEIVGDSAETFRIVTLGFLANPRFDDDGNFTGGGDGYPFPNTNTDPEAGEVGDQDVIDRVNRVNLDEDGFQDGATGNATFKDDGTEQDALAEYLFDNFPPDDDPNTPVFSEEDTPPAEDERIINLALDEEPTELRSDFDGDGFVNNNDLGIFAAAFGSTEADNNFDPNVDLTGDGLINLDDLGIIASEFGSSIA
jgi:predicted extracellular nuclease/2',3'-cyclic-nucleotide 2'-phosphodiesterase (5'-nucleotidase family)